jgi:hypothetical protein
MARASYSSPAGDLDERTTPPPDGYLVPTVQNRTVEDERALTPARWLTWG